MVVKEPESQFIPAPAGVHSAVCVDEIDLGIVHSDMFNTDSHKVRLVWQIGENMKDGKPYLIKKDYTASLHEKAGLRKDLESWRGRPFTFDELVGFDLENIIGSPCTMNIVHKPGKKGGMFANISAIMPLAKGMAKLYPTIDYVRVRDRKAADEQPAQEPFAPIEDDDVPF